MSSIPFNMARGAANILQMAPPFAFSDVTMSVFPLRASLPTLENFCRNYLNQAPDLVQFRPFIPYVYLVILDYGRMSVEAANMGWISQREVAFGVPMRWLNATKNGLEFHDWAFTSPFIFVDNELSMSTGREVFGWPKLLARLDPSVSEWVRNPHGARRVFEISTQGATKGYSGQTSEYHSLLSVYQHRTAGLLDLPPNLDSVTKPIAQAPKIAASLSRLSLDLSKTFLGMLSDGITGSSVLPDTTIRFS
ncbi:MAG: acetoacetate decarboxylase family protein, partial [Litoreibacter sp.]|nr:acetoacetate decarboxylase family protein [Litoreibacter sp.]